MNIICKLAVHNRLEMPYLLLKVLIEWEIFISDKNNAQETFNSKYEYKIQIENEWHSQGWLDNLLVTQKIHNEFRLAYIIKVH